MLPELSLFYFLFSGDSSCGLLLSAARPNSPILLPMGKHFKIPFSTLPSIHPSSPQFNRKLVGPITENMDPPCVCSTQNSKPPVPLLDQWPDSPWPRGSQAQETHRELGPTHLLRAVHPNTPSPSPAVRRPAFSTLG